MRTHNSYFFSAFNILLLVLVFAGFSSRAALAPDQLPPPRLTLYFHAVVAGGWFVLVVCQSVLIKWGKHKIHRKLGWFGVGLAAVIVLSGVIMIVENNLRHFLWVQVVSNSMNLIVFTVLFSIGIAQRRNLDFHRKLMIYSSLALMPPALARLSDSLTDTPILSAVLWLGLLVAIPIFEWTCDRTTSSASRLGVSMNLTQVIATIVAAAIFPPVVQV